MSGAVQAKRQPAKRSSSQASRCEPARHATQTRGPGRGQLRPRDRSARPQAAANHGVGASIGAGRDPAGGCGSRPERGGAVSRRMPRRGRHAAAGRPCQSPKIWVSELRAGGGRAGPPGCRVGAAAADGLGRAPRPSCRFFASRCCCKYRAPVRSLRRRYRYTVRHRRCAEISRCEGGGWLVRRRWAVDGGRR